MKDLSRSLLTLSALGALRIAPPPRMLFTQDQVPAPRRLSPRDRERLAAAEAKRAMRAAKRAKHRNSAVPPPPTPPAPPVPMVKAPAESPILATLVIRGRERTLVRP